MPGKSPDTVPIDVGQSRAQRLQQEQARQQKQPCDLDSTRLFEGVRVIGDPMKKNPAGEPQYPSLCLFIADDSNIEHIGATTIIASETTHDDGLRRFSEMVDKRSGVDVSRVERRRRSKTLRESYVPLIMRGRGDWTECCVRMDSYVSMDKAIQAMEIMKKVLKARGVEADRVRIVCNDEERLVDEAMSSGRMFMLEPSEVSGYFKEVYIENSRFTTPTGTRMYKSPSTGAHLVLPREFRRIANGLHPQYERHEEVADALPREGVNAMLSEMRDLLNSRNRDEMQQLSFAVTGGEMCTRLSRELTEIADYATSGEPGAWVNDDESLSSRIRAFAGQYESILSEEISSGKPPEISLRDRTYDILRNVASNAHEIVGVDREFYSRIRWVGGARVGEGGVTMHVNGVRHVPGIVAGICREYSDEGEKGNVGKTRVEHVNIGLTSNSGIGRVKEDSGTREVFVVEYKLRGEDRPRVRILRKLKFDDEYMIKNKGATIGGVEYHTAHVSEAKAIAGEYTTYCLTRVDALKRMGMDISLAPNPIHITENLGGNVEGRVTFIGYDYVPGMITRDIPAEVLSDTDFMRGFEYKMGVMGADRLGSHNRWFDMGDEVLDPSGNVIAIDFSRTFGDIGRRLEDNLDGCAIHLARNLTKCDALGVDDTDLRGIRSQFLTGLGEELEKLKSQAIGGSARFRTDAYSTLIEEPPTVSSWNPDSQWRKAMDDLKSCDPGRIAGLVDDRTTEVMSVLKGGNRGLMDVRRILSVTDAYSRLLREYYANVSTDISEVTRVVEGDQDFTTDGWERRVDKLNMMRLSNLAHKTGHDIERVMSFARECSADTTADSRRVGSLVFADKVVERFRGLELSDGDIVLITRVAFDQEFSRELRGKGYLTPVKH
ncbi:MAG: hypothetical protein ABIH11_05530 [Candidatus Altiarchaeota archaeon]